MAYNVPGPYDPFININLTTDVSFSLTFEISETPFAGLTEPANWTIFIQITVSESIYEMNATLQFYYDELNLPPGISEDNLDIYRYNGTDWVPMGSTVNTAENYLSIEMTNFSYYAIIGQESSGTTPTPPNTPPDNNLFFIIIIIIAIALAAAVPVAVVFVRRSRSRRHERPSAKVDIRTGLGGKIKATKTAFSKGLAIDDKLKMLIEQEIPIEYLPEIKDYSLIKHIKQEFTPIPLDLLEKIQRLDLSPEDAQEIIEDLIKLPKEAQEEFLKEFS